MKRSFLFLSAAVCAASGFMSRSYSQELVQMVSGPCFGTGSACSSFSFGSKFEVSEKGIFALPCDSKDTISSLSLIVTMPQSSVESVNLSTIPSAFPLSFPLQLELMDESVAGFPVVSLIDPKTGNDNVNSLLMTDTYELTVENCTQPAALNFSPAN